MKQVKILFFINDVTPTPEEFQTAAKTRAHVVFRNATVVPNEQHAIEECDGVMGAVPEIYAKACPSADEAIAKHERELRDAIDKAGGRVGKPDLQPLMREHATQKLPVTDDQDKNVPSDVRTIKGEPGDDEDESEDESENESEDEDKPSPTHSKPPSGAQPQHGAKPGQPQHGVKPVQGKGGKAQQRVAPPSPAIEPSTESGAPAVSPNSPAWKPNT